MEEALHIFWHALKDSVIIVPFLFLVYVLIEVIEMYSVSTIRSKHLLQGKYSPLIASSLGLVPQCGFSVMATNLYITRIISLGTLISVYLSTSDEMLPILIAHGSSFDNIFKILLTKLLFGIFLVLLLICFIKEVLKILFMICVNMIIVVVKRRVLYFLLLK